MKPLTLQEKKLYAYLLNKLGKVCDRDELLSAMWHDHEGVETRIVDVYIGYVKKKLPPSLRIESVRGKGYRMVALSTVITRSAIKVGDPEVTFSGKRHGDCIILATRYGIPPPIAGVQGFIDSGNNFLTREEAAQVAYSAGQSDRLVDILYSENLY